MKGDLGQNVRSFRASPLSSNRKHRALRTQMSRPPRRPLHWRRRRWSWEGKKAEGKEGKPGLQKEGEFRLATAAAVAALITVLRDLGTRGVKNASTVVSCHEKFSCIPSKCMGQPRPAIC